MIEQLTINVDVRTMTVPFARRANLPSAGLTEEVRDKDDVGDIGGMVFPAIPPKGALPHGGGHLLNTTRTDRSSPIFAWRSCGVRSRTRSPSSRRSAGGAKWPLAHRLATEVMAEVGWRRQLTTSALIRNNTLLTGSRWRGTRLTLTNQN